MKNRSLLLSIFDSDKESREKSHVIKQAYNLIGVFIVAINSSGKIKFANNKASEMLGYNKSELNKKNFITDILFEQYQKETKELIQQTFNYLTTKDIRNRSLVFKNKEGSKLSFEAKISAIKNTNSKIVGFIISGEEVSQYMKTQKRLKSQIELYESLANNIPNIKLYLFNDKLNYIIDDGIKSTNKKSENNDDRLKEKFYPLNVDAINGKKSTTILVHEKKYYLTHSIPLKNDDDEVYAGITIARDITEERQNERRLRESERKAIESDKKKSQFLASVSHEIRTPLNAISGFTEQLLKTETNSRQTEFIDIIEKSSEHLLNLVNDVLVYSKIEVNELNFENTIFNFNDLIQDVYKTFKFSTKNKGIDFKLENDEALDCTVLSDRFRLRQVLVNLVNNAVKFTHSGYVKIFAFKKLDLKDEIVAEIRISDTGIGIPEEKQSEIFKPFKQAGSYIAKNYKGTGLGLTLSRKIIELLGGSLSLCSEVEKGSVFTIILPLKTTSVKQVDTTSHIRSTDTKILKDKKILLVDDDFVNRLLGKTVLDNFEGDIDLAENGKEAIIKAGKKKYDIIFLDIHMPDIDGFQVAKTIREIGVNQETSIIAVTAAIMKNEIEEFKNCGINDYLIKPYKEIDVFNKLLKVLGVNRDSLKHDKIKNKKNYKQKYDLTELKEMSKGDIAFQKEMLKTFIDNSYMNIDLLKNAVKIEDWHAAGEVAHKMLPSFKHLGAKDLVEDITKLKYSTLIKKDINIAEKCVKSVLEKTKDIIKKLEEEFERL